MALQSGLVRFPADVTFEVTNYNFGGEAETDLHIEVADFQESFKGKIMYRVSQKRCNISNNSYYMAPFFGTPCVWCVYDSKITTPSF